MPFLPALPAADVSGAKLIELRVLSDAMADSDGPEHLEEILTPVQLHAEVNALHVVGDNFPLVSDHLLHQDPGHVGLYQVSWPEHPRRVYICFLDELDSNFGFCAKIPSNFGNSDKFL